MKRILALILAAALSIGCAGGTGCAAATNYDKYSNAKHGFGLGLNTTHQTPGNGEAVVFPKYNAIYHVKTKEKKIYLSFDCGYENGHTGTILDTLKKYDVKAIFFVTKPYIQQCPGLVKRMKKEGHLVGNHTVNHPSLPSCTVERIQKEIRDCASYMKKKTGYKMDRYLRPPMGEWSNRVLKVAQDMGYTTVFWSMAFYDYDEANQPGAAAIYNQFMKYYHKGALPLIHVISRSDTEALPSILKDMLKKGYTFSRLDEAGQQVYAAKVKQKVKQSTYRRENGDIVQNYECRYPVISGVGKAGGVINGTIEEKRKSFKQYADNAYLAASWRLGAEPVGEETTVGAYEQKMKVVYNQQGILSLRVKKYHCAPGAACGVTEDDSAVYSLKTGEKVTLARLLGLSSDRKANSRVKKGLRKKYGNTAEWKEKIRGVKSGDYSYYLTKKGKIRIVFGPGYFASSPTTLTLER